MTGRTLVVVFGAAVRPDGSPSPTLARRVGYAAAFAENLPAADLFCTGGVGRHGPSEASVMAAMLGHAVSASRIVLDEASGDTLQSVRAAAAYARANGYGDVVTCTDAYHQPRVGMLFRLYGLRSRPIRLPRRASPRLALKMRLREAAAIPYDLFAGMGAVWRDRQASRRDS